LNNESNVYKYVKPFNTHIFKLTSNNKTAVYHTSNMPVAASACSPVHCARL